MAQLPPDANVSKSDSDLQRTIVAIDFGTSRTAVAFAPKYNNGDKRVYSHQEWDDTFVGHKTKTAILLDSKDNHCIAFGNAAEKQYIDGVQSLIEETKTCENSVEKTAESNDLFFSKFKMALYDCNQKGEKIAIRTKIRAANGVECNAETVFVAALKQIKDYSLKWIEGHLAHINPTVNDIDWIVTVPAIWSDLSKEKMRKWSISAGLTYDINDCKYRTDHFRVAYEPDCAAIYAISELKLAKIPFQKDDIYILCDLGGGTADIAVHQMVDDNRVRELSMPSGGPFGSTRIDDAFRNMLTKVFTANWVVSFMVTHPRIFVELMDNFVKAKESFKIEKSTTAKNSKRTVKYHRVLVPVEFLETMDERLEKSILNYSDIESMVDDFEFQQTKGLWMLEDNYFKISNKIWISLFDKILNPIVRHIQSKIAEHPNVKYISLVGGLNESKYVRSRFSDEFGPNSRYAISMVTPDRPILAVVKGGALLGLESDFVSQRIAAKTYGYGVGKHISEFAAENIDIPPFVMAEKFRNPRTKQWCVPYLRIILSKGESMPIHTTIRKEQYFRAKNCGSQLNIYCTDMRSPLWKTDGVILGTVAIPYPPDWQLTKPVTVVFEFGDTTIKTWVEFGEGKSEEIMVTYDYKHEFALEE